MTRALAAVLALGLAGCSALGGEPGSFEWIGRSRVLPRTPHGAIAVLWAKEPVESPGGAYVPVERGGAGLDPHRDRIVVGTSAGTVVAYRRSGAEVYRVDAGAAVNAPVTCDPVAGYCYVATAAGELIALRSTDGRERFRVDLGDGFDRAPLIDSDAVFVVSAAGVVSAVSARDGEILWTYRRPPAADFAISGHAGLAVDDERIYAGFADGVVVGLRKGDGGVRWEVDTSVDLPPAQSGTPRFADVDTTPVLHDGRLYVASFGAGLYVLRPDNGAVLERERSLRGVTGIASHSEFLVIASATEGTAVLRTDVDGLRPVWRRAPERGAPTPPVVTEHGIVFVGESEGSLLALSLHDGRELDRIDGGYGFSAPVTLSAGVACSLTNGGRLFALSVR